MRWALPLCALLLVTSMSGAADLAVEVVEALACADEGCEAEGCTESDCDDCSLACACSCCPQRVATIHRGALTARTERVPSGCFEPTDEPPGSLAGTDIFQPPRA